MSRSAAEALVVEVRQVGDAFVVRLVGSADAAEAEELQLRLEQLATLEPRAVVLDMGDLAFICSAGLGALLSAYARLGHKRGSMRVVRPQPLIQRLLEMTCLTRVFPVYETVDDALNG